MNVLGRFAAVAVFGTLLWAACGDDSSADDGVAFCKEMCAKMQACLPDVGPPPESCDQSCTPRDGGGGGDRTCTNQSEINSAARACLDKSCEQFFDCFTKLPPCQGGTGSGGSGGTGGSTGGSGGTGGGGTAGSGGTSGDAGATCADLLACCNASTNESIKTQCLAGYNTVMQQGDAACASILSGIKSSVCP